MLIVIRAGVIATIATNVKRVCQPPPDVLNVIVSPRIRLDLLKLEVQYKKSSSIRQHREMFSFECGIAKE